MTPLETFATWRAEIEGEMREARQQLVNAEGVMAEATTVLNTVIAEREALLTALRPLDAPVIDERRGTLRVPQVATAIGRRARDSDETVRAAQSAVTRAASSVQHARDALADLELAARQLGQLEQSAASVDTEPSP